MVVRYYSSVATPTTLSAGINNSTTTITVAATTGFPTLFPYTLALDFDTALTELVDVTNAAGTTLTVTRAVDGTSATSHSAGASVRHVASGRDYADSRAHENSDTEHGVTGFVVGTGNTQTLTNKTLTSPIINTPTITGGTMTGTTLTTPVISDFTNAQHNHSNAAGGGPLGNVSTGNITTTGTISVSGLLTASNALTVSSGHLTVSTGNLIVTAGNATIGGSATAQSVVSNTTVVAGSGITSTTGNITATAGNLTAPAGAVNTATSSTTGNASVGGTLTVTGNVTAPNLAAGTWTNITLNAGYSVETGGTPQYRTVIIGNNTWVELRGRIRKDASDFTGQETVTTLPAPVRPPGVIYAAVAHEWRSLTTTRIEVNAGTGNVIVTGALPDDPFRWFSIDNVRWSLT